MARRTTKPLTKSALAAAKAMESHARDLEAFAASESVPLASYAMRATALSYRRQALLMRRCGVLEIEAAELTLRKRMDS